MSNHWTKEQEEALSVRGKNLLLSAAAGSGKTAVLTERIARLAKSGRWHSFSFLGNRWPRLRRSSR